MPTRPSFEGAISVVTGASSCIGRALSRELHRWGAIVYAASRTERKKVKDALDDGDDPDCPRHGPGTRLVRAGRDLVCMACGVAYAKAS